jgi:hypothetical protein
MQMPHSYDAHLFLILFFSQSRNTAEIWWPLKRSREKSHIWERESSPPSVLCCYGRSCTDESAAVEEATTFSWGDGIEWRRNRSIAGVWGPSLDIWNVHFNNNNNPENERRKWFFFFLFESEEEESHTHDDDSDAAHFPSVRAWMYNLHNNNRTTSRLVDISNFLLHLQDLLFITLFRVMSISGFSRTAERNYFIFWFVIQQRRRRCRGMTHIDVLIDDNDDELLLVFSLLFFFVWMIWHDTNLTLHSRRPKREKKKKKQKRNETNWRIVSRFKGGG